MVLALTAAVLLAEEPPMMAGGFGPGIAESKAISDNIVRGRVLLPSGKEITFAQFEGAMVKVRDTESDFYYGLIPLLEGEGFKVKVYTIDIRGPGLEALSYVETIDLAKGTEMGIAKRGVSMVIDEVTVPEKGDFPGKGQCCLSCGTTTSYGCAVSDTCGSCCVPPCCTPSV